MPIQHNRNIGTPNIPEPSGVRKIYQTKTKTSAARKQKKDAFVCEVKLGTQVWLSESLLREDTCRCLAGRTQPKKKNYIEAIQSEHPEDNKKQQSVWKEQNQRKKKTRRDCLRVKATRGNFQLSIFFVSAIRKKTGRFLEWKPPSRSVWKLIEWTNEPTTRDDSEIKIFQEKKPPIGANCEESPHEYY